ncbi:MAG TPA: hypothetical protein VG889_05000 [Rhizomicrobium sp.]|nr:hypothetical protein [Rhizomicrobium sp.]
MKRLVLLVFVALPARAADFQFEGYGDFRLVMAPKTEPMLDGGLGKLRFGEDDGGLEPGDIVGEGRVIIVPELTATATTRINPDYGLAVDLIESYVRYRPVSTTDLRWSVKVGAFFPPISLENDQIGWSSFWTLTPSAINSWIGDELRIIGAEGTLEWRRASGDITVKGAVFGWNDPAGVVIADRGWDMSDRIQGLFDHTRLPDAAAFRGAPPVFANLFTEMDDTPGWYLDLSWEPAEIAGFEVMRYDNQADPKVVKGGQVAWHTSFWDIGFQKQIGKLTLLSQGMSGATTIAPSPFFHQTTDFRSAYALAGYDMDKVWLAARYEVFQTRTRASFPSDLNEDGQALTLSLSWLPKTWLRFTGELIAMDDRRDERAAEGEDPHRNETQFQLLARVYF